MLASLLGYAIPLSWYLSNYTHITTKLCINRHNPNVKCNGVCQLKDRMSENEDHDHKDDENKATSIDRNHRIDLYVNNYADALVKPPVPKNRFPSIKKIAASLWINEPLSPPPKLG